jgi:hypothetical protein
MKISITFKALDVLRNASKVAWQSKNMEEDKDFMALDKYEQEEEKEDFIENLERLLSKWISHGEYVSGSRPSKLSSCCYF